MKTFLKSLELVLFFALGSAVLCSGEEGPVKTLSPEPPPVLAAQANALDIALQPLTLRDCYELALKQSEVVAVDEELVQEAQAHFTQSLGTILPQASYVFSQSNTDSGFSPFGRDSSEEAKFVFKQTLFSGFREFAAMAGSRLEKKQYQEQKKRAEQLLFTDVADAFYLVLEYQEDIKTLETIRAALADRIAELNKREEIGRSRHSEVVSTEAQLYNAEAQIELVKSQELVARELLNFLTGRIVEKVEDQEIVPDTLQAPDVYESKADARPDVKMAKYAWGVKQKQVTVSRSDLFPTVTLEGDYYQTQAVESPDADWSTLLKVSVPLFEGTTTYGDIRAARSQARQAELLFQRAQRSALRDIRNSFVRAQSAAMQFKAFEKALNAADTNYTLQKEDYQKSLVSNLDVLAAIQTLGNARRNYVHALYEHKRLYWQLRAAIGDINQEPSL